MANYGIGPTAGALLNRPYQGAAPFAPAGITDTTRTGWASQLQGLGQEGQAANYYAGRFGNYGRGGNLMPAATPSQVQGIGASFDPWNPHLRSEIGAANQQMVDQFSEHTMPGINRGLAGGGPGAYGGTRAGITQGLATQGLMDAVQKNTTDMTSRGYAEGLQRYVQDRANTLGALNQERGQFRNAYGDERALGFKGLEHAANYGMQGARAGTEMGNRLTGFGGQMQRANQGVQDWYNQQYAHAQGYPGQQFSNYAGWVKPITEPGQKGATGGTIPTAIPNYSNPWGGAAAGAQAGIGMYGDWQRTQNPGGYGGYGSSPVAGDAYGPAYGPQSYYGGGYSGGGGGPGAFGY